MMSQPLNGLGIENVVEDSSFIAVRALASDVGGCLQGGEDSGVGSRSLRRLQKVLFRVELYDDLISMDCLDWQGSSLFP
jgi:hypothetical protein